MIDTSRPIEGRTNFGERTLRPQPTWKKFSFRHLFEEDDLEPCGGVIEIYGKELARCSRCGQDFFVECMGRGHGVRYVLRPVPSIEY